MTFDNYLAFFAVFAFIFGFFTFMYIDLRKEWKRKKRDELRRDSFIRSVQTISEYCYYKGISEGFDMSSNQE